MATSPITEDKTGTWGGDLSLVTHSAKVQAGLEVRHPGSGSPSFATVPCRGLPGSNKGETWHLQGRCQRPPTSHSAGSANTPCPPPLGPIQTRGLYGVGGWESSSFEKLQAVSNASHVALTTSVCPQA